MWRVEAVMRYAFLITTAALVAIVIVVSGGVVRGQQPAFGPTATAMPAATAAWPARPPARIYVVPFAMEPGLQEQLRQQAQSSIIPQGPVRQLIAARPRVTDMVTGNDRSLPVGTSVAKLVADDLAAAGLPAVLWTNPGPPPTDGWRLVGQVVSLDEGSAAARNVVGFGVGNKHVGIDVALADPLTAGGQPFFILDSSDAGRRMPGTLPIAAVAGFNPAVVVGKVVASNSGLADISQQQRLAGEISGAVKAGLEGHGMLPRR
jgi:hypothetical protein